jgi:hypothetical protein
LKLSRAGVKVGLISSAVWKWATFIDPALADQRHAQVVWTSASWGWIEAQRETADGLIPTALHRKATPRSLWAFRELGLKRVASESCRMAALICPVLAKARPNSCVPRRSRFQCDRLPEMRQGFFRASQAGERISQVVAGRGVGWVKLEGLGEVPTASSRSPAWQLKPESV